MDRTGQVWEIDLNDDGFHVEDDDTICYVVLGRLQTADGRGWVCMVLIPTKYENPGHIMYRPEYDVWEEQPTKYRRLA